MKTATCVTCEAAISSADRAATVESFDVGVAGGSARKIADRQQARRKLARQARDDGIRDAHPRVGKLLVKARHVLAEPDKPTSWQKGASGEESAGKTLDRLAGEGFVVLHDRRKPGTKWNIDHVVVGPKGVYAIDAKHCSGPARSGCRGRGDRKTSRLRAWTGRLGGYAMPPVTSSASMEASSPGLVLPRSRARVHPGATARRREQRVRQRGPAGSSKTSAESARCVRSTSPTSPAGSPTPCDRQEIAAKTRHNVTIDFLTALFKR